MSLLAYEDAARHYARALHLLVQRPDHLRQHAGQVGLPGGAVEPGDADGVAAALREAQEEVGLDPSLVASVMMEAGEETVSEFFDADDLVPVSQAHIMADTESLGVADSYHRTPVGVWFGEPGVRVPDPYFGGAATPPGRSSRPPASSPPGSCSAPPPALPRPRLP